MKSHILQKTLIFTIVAMLLFLIVGCNKKSQKPQQSTSDKPPEVLTNVEKNIDSIIDSLDKEGKIEESTSGQKSQGIRESSNTPSSKSQGSQEGQGGQSTQSGQSSQGGQGQSQQGQGQQGTGQQSQQQNPWDQADKTIKQIHMQWSQFQPEAVKTGVSSQVMDNFSNDLNTLTNDISVKNLMTTLNDANNLYKYIPEFMSHYKDKTVDLKRLKYYVRDIMYKSRFDKWNLATDSANSAKNLLPNLRSQAKDENKKKYQSLEYSVYELEKVVKEGQKSLTQIKANVILNNIKDIEKSSKKSESQSQSQ